MTERHVWLTLVGHADHMGIVTRCPIGTIADYVRVTPTTVRTTIENLRHQGQLRVLPAGRSRHYHLLGEWREDRVAARRFIDLECERVRSLQNRRSRLYHTTKNAPVGPRLRILDIEPQESLTRFTLRINTVGLIRFCSLLKRSDGTHFLGEPAKRVGLRWQKTCNLDPTVASEAIDAVLHPREDMHSTIASGAYPEFRVSDLTEVTVDERQGCRWRMRCTVAIPGIVTVRDCAVTEQHDGTITLVGPAKPLSGKWPRTVVFDEALATAIVQSVLSMRTAA